MYTRCSPVRERDKEKESRKCERALSVPHSVSQSACVVIILILNLLQFLLPGGSMGPVYVLLFNLMKNHKIANKSTAIEAIKISLMYDSTKFENYPILLNKFCHQLIQLCNKLECLSLSVP